MKKNSLENITGYVVALLLAAYLLAGCSAPGPSLAELCATNYPCKDTVYVEKRTIVDTFYLDGAIIEVAEEVDCPPSDSGATVTKVIEVEVPGRTIIREVTVLDTNRCKKDSALIAHLREQVAAKNEAIRKMRQENLKPNNLLPKGLPWWVYVLTALLTAGAGWFVFNKKRA